MGAGRAASGLVSMFFGIALVTQSACGPPCEDDPLGCGAGGEFSFAPSCELTGSLDVALGEGVSEFSPLDAGQEPTVHEGLQGGHHLSLGLRVDNPALDYPYLKVIFDAELNDPELCGEDPECDPWVSTGHRELVLGPELPLDAEDAVQQAGFILVISLWPTDLERRVHMEVVDPCRREGAVEHLIPPASGS